MFRTLTKSILPVITTGTVTGTVSFYSLYLYMENSENTYEKKKYKEKFDIHYVNGQPIAISVRNNSRVNSRVNT